MATFVIKIVDENGNILARDEGEGIANLLYEAEYKEGDRIEVETDTVGVHVHLQLDDGLGSSMCYLTGPVSYLIPHGEKRVSYSPHAFAGNRHYLYVKEVVAEEIYGYRNLALNVNDAHGDMNMFPHSYANVETRGEAVFASRNAIDGVCENRSHGEWPYQSWGINRQDDAEMTIDFGREVETDKIILYTRADFPHDNWWVQVKLTFSDGSEIVWNLEKSYAPHVLDFEKKNITWVKLSDLIKADDPSPFPALTQMEVYGRDAK